MIELKNVSKRFGDQLVLDDITLHIPADNCVCLIGGSGAGKSLLARIILGLEPADSGKISINGYSPLQLSPDSLKQLYGEIGVVFQANALFDSLTVRENIGLRLDEEGVPGQDVDRLVLESLKKVGLDSHILDQLPASLSGGMQKRVGIARAIVHQPSLLVYDEPTSGLDPVNADRIDQLIASIQAQEGQTSLIITHDLDSVHLLADTIILLHQGRIHFTGTWQQFAASEDPVVSEFLKRRRAEKKPPLGGGSI